MIEYLGWLGSILLITCGLPQVYKTLTTKNVQGLSLTTNLMWTLGCLSMFGYEFFTSTKIPLLVNYFFSTSVAFLLVILILIYRKN